jgi:hypothetical protein
MKTMQTRLVLLALSATVVAGIMAGCQSLLARNSNSLRPRFHEEVTLMIADKQEPGYSSGFTLGPRRNVGMATLSSGHQFRFVCDFICTTNRADVYALDLSLPNGSNIVETIKFSGEAQLIHETDTERIEMTQPTNH